MRQLVCAQIPLNHIPFLQTTTLKDCKVLYKSGSSPGYDGVADEACPRSTQTTQDILPFVLFFNLCPLCALTTIVYQFVAFLPDNVLTQRLVCFSGAQDHKRKAGGGVCSHSCSDRELIKRFQVSRGSEATGNPQRLAHSLCAVAGAATTAAPVTPSRVTQTEML